MIHRRRASTVLFFALVSCARAPTMPPSVEQADVGAVQNELLQITRERLGAIAKGDWATWDRYLDDAVMYTDENGKVLTKADLKEDFHPLPPGYSGSIEIASFEVRWLGHAAVVNHADIEHEQIFGQRIEARYRTTDTYVRHDGGWRLVAAQVMVLPSDPPAATANAKSYGDYVGTYELAPSVTLVVTRDGNRLFGERAGRPKQEWIPEADAIFFVPGSPRSRKIFVRDAGGKVTRLLDRRDGRDLVWTRVDPPFAPSATGLSRSRTRRDDRPGS
jgi:hypothetical protein